MKACFRTILFSSLSTLAAFFAITYTSCNPDKCKSIVCAYGGVCNNGACLCATGYEGTQCETTSRDKYIGTWTVLEKGSSANAANYSLSLIPGANISDIVLNNFNNQFNNVTGNIRVDSIYIPTQTVNGNTIIGTGYFLRGSTYSVQSEIIMKYKVTNQTTGIENDYGYDSADNSASSMWSK